MLSAISAVCVGSSKPVFNVMGGVWVPLVATLAPAE